MSAWDTRLGGSGLCLYYFLSIFFHVRVPVTHARHDNTRLGPQPESLDALVGTTGASKADHALDLLDVSIENLFLGLESNESDCPVKH